MDNYSFNGYTQLEDYETPFAEVAVTHEDTGQNESAISPNQFATNFESPFTSTFETNLAGQKPSTQGAADFVQFLGELHSDEFGEHLYEMALELEDSLNNKISNETAMGDRFIPFATQESYQYFEPVLNETTRMIDQVRNRFAGNNLADQNEADIQRYFETLELNHGQLSPAQEQFFGSILKKVKSVVSTGVNLAKKGIAAVGKILPIGPVLDKLKGLVRPLLDKVLKFAIGKLPKNLQPHAQTLAKKFLNLETAPSQSSESDEMPSAGNLEAIQSELDNHIANLVFSPSEAEADNLVMSYETSSDAQQREDMYETGGMNLPSLDVARQNLINELKNLPEGESPAPAIERFLPVAIMALQPVIKIAINLIGRPKIINFLAGLLAKLVGKFVPENIAQPLAASIIDIGMSAIGFETHERNKSDLAYEAVVNTIQETIQNLGTISEAALNDHETLMSEALEAFEKAAANNFPPQQIKAAKHVTAEAGTWVMMPRRGPKHLFKKFTRVFDTTIDNRIATSLTTFRGIPLAGYLKDKLGLDVNQPIKARVHVYEGIPGTKLYLINRFDKVPGLGVRHGYKQFHPLSVQAASLLLKEPKLGKDVAPQFTAKRHRTAVGQRFYYLEIPGAQLKVVTVTKPSLATATTSSTPTATPAVNTSDPAAPPVQNFISKVPGSSDIQGVINFTRAEIRFNYFFSEEEAKEVANKLNQRDIIGAFGSVRYSIRSVLHGILVKNIGSKVKIIHEAMPELFMDNFEEKQEQFWGAIGSAIGGVASSVGKEVAAKILEKLVEKVADAALQSVVNYFKTRVNEFITAQAAPQDGVTIKIIWYNIPGMSAISAILNAYKGKLSVGNVADLVLPSLPAPEIKVTAGKQFD